MLKQGVWYTYSASDPRWNVSGEGKVGMGDHRQALQAIEDLKATLGEPPADLEVGYMKD